MTELSQTDNDIGLLHHYANFASRNSDFELMMIVGKHQAMQGSPNVGDDWTSAADLIKLSAKNWLEDGGAAAAVADQEEVDMGDWLIQTDHLRGVIQRPYDRNYEFVFIGFNKDDLMDTVWDGIEISKRLNEKACIRAAEMGVKVDYTSWDVDGNPTGELEPTEDWFVGPGSGNGNSFVLTKVFAYLGIGSMKGMWVTNEPPNLRAISKSFGDELLRIENAT